MQKQARLQDANLSGDLSDHESRSIGALLQELHSLSDVQVQQIVRYQDEQGVRFGDAAVALRLATHEDIVVLLAKQFHFPNIPRLAVTTAPCSLLVADDATSAVAEPFRDLRTELMMMRLDSNYPWRALALVSPASGDGKSFIASNLAAAFSQIGGRTLLVDANLRCPGLAAIFGIDEYADGLTTLLSGWSGMFFHQIASLPGLFVMTAGPPRQNPQELLQRASFGHFIDEAVRIFDHVIIDSPARALGSDYRTIAATAGMALAVARQDQTDLRAMAEVLAALENSNSTIAGVVLNHR